MKSMTTHHPYMTDEEDKILWLAVAVCVAVPAFAALLHFLYTR